jgi:hypothetical protein
LHLPVVALANPTLSAKRAVRDMISTIISRASRDPIVSLVWLGTIRPRSATSEPSSFDGAPMALL